MGTVGGSLWGPRPLRSPGRGWGGAGGRRPSLRQGSPAGKPRRPEGKARGSGPGRPPTHARLCLILRPLPWEEADSPLTPAGGPPCRTPPPEGSLSSMSPSEGLRGLRALGELPMSPHLLTNRLGFRTWVFASHTPPTALTANEVHSRCLIGEEPPPSPSTAHPFFRSSGPLCPGRERRC